MNDFTILHLSDLHMDKKGEKLSLLMENLVVDIEKEMVQADNIIIIVTGDIVHKANYESRKNVLVFFEKLKNCLGEKVKEICIVPGNHDKVRNEMDEFIAKNYIENPEDFYKKYWKYMRMDFDEYLELQKDIYEIFIDDAERLKDKIFKNTYGVSSVEIEGKIICFLLLNTAWNSIGDNDERNLKIGKFQMEELRQKYEELLDAKGHVDLTVVVAHHPIDWLDGLEENNLRAHILSNNGLNANVYISGHTHNRDVINWNNNRHSMTTLVSGIGWPDEHTSHPYVHTYSSYVFNLDVNSIDVYVRSSNDDYTFESDFRIYTSKRNKEQNKIVMPINSCKTQAYFNLGNVSGRSPKACYITDEIMQGLRDHVTILGNFRREMSTNLMKLKTDCLDFLKENKLCKNDIEKVNRFFYYGDESIRDKCVEILSKFPELIYMQYTTYLQEICECFRKSVKFTNSKTRIRTHFRVLNSKTEEYEQLCLSGDGFDNYTMKPLKWGELLAASYEAKSPLIASVNKQYCKESIANNNQKSNKTTLWEDFITIIPDFSYNIYTKRNIQTDKKEDDKPYITFGITIYDVEDRSLLYVWDYLRLDKTVGDIIRDFLFVFPLDMNNYVKYIIGGCEE